jgi:hypothetical protein
VTGQRLGLFGHTDAAGPFRWELEGRIDTSDKLFSDFSAWTSVTEMDEIQEGNSLKLGDKINPSN